MVIVKILGGNMYDTYLHMYLSSGISCSSVLPDTAMRRPPLLDNSCNKLYTSTPRLLELDYLVTFHNFLQTKWIVVNL